MGRASLLVLELAVLAGWLLLPTSGLSIERPRKVKHPTAKLQPGSGKAEDEQCENRRLDAAASTDMMTCAELSSAIYGSGGADRHGRVFPPEGFEVLASQLTQEATLRLDPVWALIRDPKDGPSGPMYAVFRGTKSTTDVSVVISTTVYGLDNQTGLVSSWSKVARKVVAQVMEAAHSYAAKAAVSPPRVLFTGHSIGGALAALSGHFFRQETGRNDTHAYCFNAPPFMSESTPESLRQNFDSHTTSIMAEFDPITRVQCPDTTPWYEALHDSVFEQQLGFIGKYGAEAVHSMLSYVFLDNVRSIGDRVALDCVWVVRKRWRCGGVPLIVHHEKALQGPVVTELVSRSHHWLSLPPPAFLHACYGNVTNEPSDETAAACTIDHPELVSNSTSQSAVNRLARGLLDAAPRLAPSFVEVFDPIGEHSIIKLSNELRTLYTKGSPLGSTTAGSAGGNGSGKGSRKRGRGAGEKRDDCAPPLQPWGAGDGLVERLERAYRDNSTNAMTQGGPAPGEDFVDSIVEKVGDGIKDNIGTANTYVKRLEDELGGPIKHTIQTVKKLEDDVKGTVVTAGSAMDHVEGALRTASTYAMKIGSDVKNIGTPSGYVQIGSDVGEGLGAASGYVKKIGDDVRQIQDRFSEISNDITSVTRWR